MAKRQAERLSYQRLRDKARNKLKLLGGTESDKAATKNEELEVQNQRVPAKKRVRKGDNETPELKTSALSLRKSPQKLEEVPSPKRRNTNLYPERMLLDIPENSVEIQNDVNQTDANNTTNISAEAKTETDLDKNSVKVMGDQPTENNGLRYNDQSPVNPEGAGVERGVGTRWNIDSDLHSEKKGSERERQIKQDQTKLKMGT